MSYHQRLARRSAISDRRAVTLTPEEWAEQISGDHHRLTSFDKPKPDAVTSFARGTYDVVHLRRGLSVSHYNLRYIYDTVAKVEIKPHAYLGMLLEGRHESSIAGRDVNMHQVGVPALFATNETNDAIGRFETEQCCNAIGVSLDPQFFEALDEDEDDAPFQRLRSVCGHPFLWQSLDRADRVTFHLKALADCPHAGVMGRLYCESHALSLVVELARLFEPSPQPRRQGINRIRSERVEHVRCLVESHLGDPLSLAEIARRVGSNETTLRLDFKAAFGKTIFEYLRDIRLDTAQQIVRSNQYTIAQVAHSLGYTSPASFSTAYKKRFGTPPVHDKMRKP